MNKNTYQNLSEDIYWRDKSTLSSQDEVNYNGSGGGSSSSSGGSGRGRSRKPINRMSLDLAANNNTTTTSTLPPPPLLLPRYLRSNTMISELYNVV